MIIEKGVEMIGLCDNLKRVLPVIDEAFDMHGNVATITATKWGRDPLRLAHESGHALDVKEPTFHEPETTAMLADALGLNYTVRHMKGHLHIEYTPLSKFPVKNRVKERYAERV